MPNTTTTNAPVGPPICREDPPSAEIKKPATTAQYNPACGGTPDAMANAIASGRATRPTVTPAITSETNCGLEYLGRVRKEFGNHLRSSGPNTVSTINYTQRRRQRRATIPPLLRISSRRPAACGQIPCPTHVQIRYAMRQSLAPLGGPGSCGERREPSARPNAGLEKKGSQHHVSRFSYMKWLSKGVVPAGRPLCHLCALGDLYVKPYFISRCLGSLRGRPEPGLARSARA